MSHSSRSRKFGSASLVAVAFLLASVTGAAQTPPPEPEPVPPAEPTPPPPPPPAPTPPAVSYPMVLPTHEIKISKDTAIRLGVQAQVWADSAQDSNLQSDGSKGGYENNIFLRRARLLVGVMPLPNITLFVLLEASNTGKATAGAPKNFAGPAVLDAFGEIKFHDAFYLEGGLLLVPVTRNIVMGTTTYIGLDIGATSAASLAALQTAVLRDVGLQAKGYLLEDHFEYRLGVFSGIRNPPLTMPTAVGSQNSPRLSAYLQYNFLDPEKGYVFNGMYYGKKKVLGVSSGVDYQKGPEKKPYFAVSATVFTNIPLNGPNPKTGGDEVDAFAQFIHYDGQETAPSIASQNDILVEAGYFNLDTKLSVFGKFEAQLFTAEAPKVNNRVSFGGGVKYHLMENYCNFTLAYLRSQYPEASTTFPGRNGTNQFTFALQVFYY